MLDLTNPEHVRTRDGREVRFYVTDGHHDWPIHGALKTSNGEWVCCCWKVTGECFNNCGDRYLVPYVPTDTYTIEVPAGVEPMCFASTDAMRAPLTGEWFLSLLNEPTLAIADYENRLEHFRLILTRVQPVKLAKGE